MAIPIAIHGIRRSRPGILHRPSKRRFVHRRSDRGATVRSVLGALGLLLASTGVFGQASTPDASIADVRDALQGGRAVVLMRHALAPGTGDPVDFEPGVCETQRNLSDAGRQQATAIGERLIALLGSQPAAVYSSSWCRCLDTARRLELGNVESLPALDSFFGDRSTEAAQTASLTRWIEARLDGDERLPTAVLVTHQVNITALTGRFAGSGEMIVVTTDDGLQVLATIETDVPAR